MPSDFPWIAISISLLLAITPVIVWARVIRRTTLDPDERRSLISIFIGGSLSVVPIFLLQALWGAVPALDPFAYIDTHIFDEKHAFLATFVLVGMMEEIVKHAVVRASDRRHPERFRTINDALRTSIVSGLGFAFAENIFYFTNIFIDLGIRDLVSAFIFRSIFTAAGHMIFSGIFGYHFGIAKFAADITEHARWEGKKFRFTRLLARMFGASTKTYEIYRERKIIEGLLYAMGIHAIFNFLLQLNMVLPVILLIAVSGLYLWYLLHRTTGHLLFSFDKRRASTMTPNDETVVIELLSMWSREGKYQEVIDICERLLARDPDNNVVKLFRAKAKDNQKLKNLYTSLKRMFEKSSATANVAAQVLKPPQSIPLTPENEKVAMEVMELWYEQGNYRQTIEVANRLLARNPQSKGALLIKQKAFDKEKLQRVFQSLSLIFSHDENHGKVES